MDYEKLYNEALEREKQFHKKELFAECNGRLVEYIFPELKESEEERIRKELVAFLEELSKLGKDTNFDRWKTSDCANWIDWLEKQVSPQMVADAYLRGCDDTEKKWLKKQSEQKAFDYENVNIQQKDFAPVEPKFKVGDWIMDKESKEVFYISKNLANTYKIVDIEGNDYHVPHYILEEDYDVWTIQDAKDGDVLADKYNNIGIFQECKGICWHSYIYLGCDGELRGFNIGGSHEQTGTHPATKEQREQLEKAMADAGYKWDAEKKNIY